MYLLGEQPAYADQLINRLQGIPAQLLEGLSPSAPTIEIKGSDDLAQDLPEQHLFIIDCCMHWSMKDRCFTCRKATCLGCVKEWNCRFVVTAARKRFA